MGNAWLEVEESGGGRRRLDLSQERLVLGGPDGALPLRAAGADRLHFTDAPARVVFEGRGAPPLIDGVAVRERELQVGDRLEWHGHVLVFRRAAQLHEDAAPAATPAPTVRGEERLWRRVKSGLLVELGIVGPDLSRPWQDAVRGGGFEPDECARALLAAAPSEDGDSRLLERTARLQRDLLMAPLQSGAKGTRRRARGAAKQGLAYAVAQLVVVAMFLGLALVGLLVGRLLLGWSIDGFLDRIGSVFGA